MTTKASGPDRVLHDRIVYTLAIISVIADVLVAPRFDAPMHRGSTAAVIIGCLLLTQFMIIRVPRRNGQPEPVPTSPLWLSMLVLIMPLGFAQVTAVITRVIFGHIHGESKTDTARSIARMVVVSSIVGIFFVVISHHQNRAQTGYLDAGGIFLCLLTSHLYIALMVASNMFDIAYRDGVSMRAVLADEVDLRLRLYAIFAFTGPVLALLSIDAPWVVLLGLISLNNTQFTARKLLGLSQRAVTDQLTGIGNRDLFTIEVGEALAAAKESSASVALFMLDIDRFKQINDTLGHPIGDVVVREVARRMNTELESGTRTFRIGGDEFVVLVPKVQSAQQLTDLGEQILNMVSRPVFFSDETHPDMDTSRLVVSTSVGVAIYPQHGADATELLKNADRAMYEAKEESNAVCFYSPALIQTSSDDLELMADLHEAVLNEHFEVHYQPKICARNGQTRGVESLVRWNHPLHGYISPEVFIPMAEQAGLIMALTNTVARHLLASLDAVHDRGHEIPFSLNISAHMLSSLAMDDWCTRVQNAPNLPLEHVTLEVTESAMNVNDRSHQMVQRLRELGMRLSVDDYGTGFSSLSRMADLGPDELKIDKSFVWKLDDPRTRAIVASTISMCEALGIHTVAEGVETERQADQLQEMGCDIFQGYLYAKPMPLAQLLPWLDERAERTGGRGGISKEAEEATRAMGVVAWR